MTTPEHRKFLEQYCLPDRHYSFEQAPLAYLYQSKNVNKETLDKALDNIDFSVKLAAADHPNATKEHLDKALSDTHYRIRMVAAEHPNATKEHLDKALSDINPSVRLAATQNLNYEEYYPNGHK